MKNLTILAIETSCDDTCVALLKIENYKLKILSNVVSSQVKIHKKYGGVYPFLAKREHQKNLPIVLKRALKEAKNPKVDLIAVTVGPGLEPCLWVGVNFAKDLAKTRAQNYFVLGRAHRVCAPKLNLKIVPINHIEAHIFANWLNRLQVTSYKLQGLFPAICLIVSGGHTQLILMKDIGQYKILGETRDDAAGECFDKVARILGLGYPGGPIISKIAKSYKLQMTSDKMSLPRPMIYQKNYDFSFSGLKTAVLYNFRSQPEKIRKSKKYIQQISAEVQQAIIDVLIEKTLRAAREYKAKSVILGGGVAANDELRKKFRERIKKEMPNTKYLIPDTEYCTDNAVMVAAAAYFNYQKGKKYNWQKVQANANLRVG